MPGDRVNGNIPLDFLAPEHPSPLSKRKHATEICSLNFRAGLHDNVVLTVVHSQPVLEPCGYIYDTIKIRTFCFLTSAVDTTLNEKSPLSLRYSSHLQGGTLGDDVFVHAAAGDDGSFVLAGWTNGLWSDSFDDSFDFAAVKLDTNGNELWRWQVIDDGGIDSA